ncbi:MAG: hypothetical protein MAG451_02446 [Anaerolineales bacterium]|nr:hypothetical protein [Anaerolineales bacterium]
MLFEKRRRRIRRQHILLLMLCVLFIFSPLYGVTTPLYAAPNIETLSSAAFMAQFDDSVGGRSSHTFIPLTDPTTNVYFATLLDAVLAADLEAAQLAIDALDAVGVRYKLVYVNDVANGPALGFMERVGPGDPDYRGWGAVLVRPATAGTRVYQAPHVKADAYSEDMALQAFVEAGARAVMFAGAHRYANGRDHAVADVAHNSDNLFHALTLHLARRGQVAGAPYWFIQFHGARDRDSEPDIVGSHGADDPLVFTESPLVLTDAAVDGAGHIGMGVCGWPEGPSDTEDGDYYLCATTNVQGDHLDSLGLRNSFVHLEIERHVRNDYRAGGGAGYEGVLTLMAGLRNTLR